MDADVQEIHDQTIDVRPIMILQEQKYIAPGVQAHNLLLLLNWNLA